MIQRWRSALVTLVAVLAVASGSVAAQSRSEASDPTVTPRSPDGHPDLRGVWDFRTVTPLERPAELAEQEFLTEEEVAAYEVQRVQERNADLNRETTVTNRRVVNGTTETADLRLAYNDFWWDRGTRVVGTHRTSLVIDPPDGRVPVLTPEGRSRAEARVARSRRPTEGPEDRSLSERCITGFNSGPPMLSGGYNQNVQIFQTADHVVLLNEMVHNARIIPLDGRPHGTVRQWTGDSRGHWEGDTLVVDTTNFLRETSFANSQLESSSRGALHTGRRRHTDLRVHGRRPDDLDATLDRPAPDDPERSAAVRVRLSGRQLRDDRHPHRRPRHRGGRHRHPLTVSARLRIRSTRSRRTAPGVLGGVMHVQSALSVRRAMVGPGMSYGAATRAQNPLDGTPR